jgi:hypothetical protein
MDASELDAFIASEHKAACATRGPRGFPHVAMLAYAVIDAQASKRVALEFIERRQSTYDHRKLPAGVY